MRPFGRPSPFTGADRMAFREREIILEDGRAFGEAMDDWQRQDFVALDSGRFRHAYLERPRGHSKTGDIGTEAVCELVLGQPGSRLFCCAADEAQARILFDDVAGKLRRNPALANLADIRQKEIVMKGTGSRLTLMNADVPSSWGLRPDWIASDEIVEWRGRGLWDSMWSATGKRPNCRVLAISTAGWDRTSIGWEVREIAASEPDWYLSARGQCASWIDSKWLESQRRTLPPHVFARLHEARWVDGVGAFLTAEEVDAVFADVPAGADSGVAIGLDIGLTRDASVAAVCANRGGIVCVDHIVTWQGRPGRKVDLEDVEAEVKQLAERLGAPVHFDPFQGVQMGQRLQRQGVVMKEYSFASGSRRRLFALILDLVRTRRFRSHPHDALRRELLGLEATETAAGWRVDHRAGQHDDHVVAAALAAQAVAGERAPIDMSGAWVADEEDIRAATDERMAELERQAAMRRWDY